MRHCTNYSTQESGPCISPGKHIKTDPVIRVCGESALKGLSAGKLSFSPLAERVLLLSWENSRADPAGMSELDLNLWAQEQENLPCSLLQAALGELA